VGYGILFSFLFHVAIVAVIIFNPFDWARDPYEDTFDVEIIEYEEIARNDEAPPPEPEPEPEPEVEEEPAPERIEEAPVVEEVAPPTTVAKDVAPARATQRVPVITPRDKPRPPSRFNLKKIGALLDKREVSDKKLPPRKLDIKLDKPKPQISDGERKRRLASIESAIAAQVSRCWSAPAGAKYAEELVVRIRINLAPDGQLIGTPKILDTSRMRSDGFFRAAAEAARRAIQRCGKLELPVQDYDIWKEVVLNFDPSKM